ncbi:uncharacterized protein LOC101860289 [Aplysia californica]|nr:uncharacterized protein LOC101860289 [Aplysia californica]
MFSPELIDAIFKVSSRWQSDHVMSAEEMVILKTLQLTLSDRCQVSDPKPIEDIQNLLMCCLEHLMRRNHRGEDHSPLIGHALNRLTTVRPLSHLEYANIAKNKLLKEFYTKRPLIKEVLDFDTDV